MKRPRVRFELFRYFSAAACTCAVVSLSSWSRCRKNKRQSPAARDSVRAIVMRAVFDVISSTCLFSCCFTRATSASVTGCDFKSSSTFSMAACAASRLPSTGTSAPNRL
ncbi:hypothetical protein D3C72_1359900 [compost metagenome]